MKRVLITGGRAPAALELARHFSLNGDRVTMADSTSVFLARASMAVHRGYRVPSARQEPRRFFEAICRIIETERIDLLVPTCEEVFYLSRYGAEIRQRTELFCPDLGLLTSLHHKGRFAEIAAGLGVEVPQAWLLHSRADLEQVGVPSDELVLKPAYSRFAAYTLIKPSKKQADATNPCPEHAWIAQRFVPGRELCSYSIARDGVLTAHCLYEPTWRAGQGSGYFFSHESSAQVEAFVGNFAAKYRFTGQLGFDFIEDANRRIHVLECNPRATSGVHLFGASDGLARAFNRDACQITRPSRPRPAMLGAAMACFGFAGALRRGHVRRFVRDFSRARDAIWSWRDPLPALHLYLGFAAFLVEAARRGISPQAASTFDLEWNGEEIP